MHTKTKASYERPANMSCTTYRLATRNPMEGDEYAAYSHYLHWQRLKRVKAAVNIPSVKKQRRKRVNGNQKWNRKQRLDGNVGNKKEKSIEQFNYNRRVQIAEENQLLLKRILAVESRKPLYGPFAADQTRKHLETFLSNRAIVKAQQRHWERKQVIKENQLIQARIGKVKPTIEMKELLQSANKRDLVLINLSRVLKKKQRGRLFKRLFKKSTLHPTCVSSARVMPNHSPIAAQPCLRRPKAPSPSKPSPRKKRFLREHALQPQTARY